MTRLTHSGPDRYITEGQIILSRELHRKGIYPRWTSCLPVPLEGQGDRAGKTREDMPTR